MASLKEIKGRIASVSSTLKITSAMKMVASAKLHKAQNLIASMIPYESQLHDMLSALMDAAAERGLPGLSAPSSSPEAPSSSPEAPSSSPEATSFSPEATPSPKSLSFSPEATSFSPEASSFSPEATSSVIAAPSSVIAGLTRNPHPIRRIAIVALSSNTSLCGAFNANAVKAATAVVKDYLASGLAPSDITVYSIGRKMAEGMKKLGWTTPADYSSLSDSPTYEKASALAQELLDKFLNGTYDKIELVYNHFKSTASQVVTRQTYLPLSLSASSASADRTGSNPVMDSIVEPSVEEMLESLLPKVVRLKIFTILLDSSAAEHAARTVAMQTATDNGNDLLAELTLEYNKSRQQKITSEILDIVGGSLQ